MHSTLKSQRAMATMVSTYKSTMKETEEDKKNERKTFEWCCTFNWIVKSFIEWKISVNFHSIHSPLKYRERRCEQIIRLNTRPFPLMLELFSFGSFVHHCLSIFRSFSPSIWLGALCAIKWKYISIQLIITDNVVFMHITFLNAPRQDVRCEKRKTEIEVKPSEAQVMIEIAYFVATFAMVSVHRISARTMERK